MAFKGGTSLSKVYGAIRRFSEDVDVTVDYKSLDQSIDPFDANTSRTARDKYSNLLRTKLAEHTKNVVRPYFESLIAELPEKLPTAISISDDGEKLFIPYASRFGADESVFLEFGGRNVIVPGEEHTLRPYIASELRDLEFPVATVCALSPTRTFWEKATLIHVACNRANPKLDADRQSRHWHDLAILADHEIGIVAVEDRKLLADVVRHKAIFFHVPYAKYDACLSGGLRLIPAKPLLEALQADYKKMIADAMFDSEPPDFDSIIARLEKLQRQINSN
jgi:hypothetical protein